MPDANRRNRTTMFAIFACALLARLVFCLVAIPLLDLPVGPNRDDFFTSSDGYIDLAVNLVDHGTFGFAADGPPTTYRAPVFPAVLALGYGVVGDPKTAVLLSNCVASALTCVVVYLIAVRFFQSRATFRLLAPVTFFPLSIYYCASGFSDTFVTLSVTLYVYAVLVLFRAPTIGKGMLSGGAFALAALTKAVVLPLPVVLCGYALLRRRVALRAATISMAVGFTLTSIWTVRNYVVTGHVIPVSGGLGFNMLVGTFTIDSGRDCDSSIKYGRAAALDHIRKTEGVNVSHDDLHTARHLDLSPEMDRLFRSSALGLFADRPFLLVRKVGINAVRFWYFSSSPLKSVINGTINLVVLLLAVLGLPRMMKSSRLEVELLLLIVVSFVGLYSLVIVHSSRFSLPVVLLLLPIATWTALKYRPKRVSAKNEQFGCPAPSRGGG